MTTLKVLMSLARMFLSARENAQRCAVDCAPYVHARLPAPTRTASSVRHDTATTIGHIMRFYNDSGTTEKLQSQPMMT